MSIRRAGQKLTAVNTPPRLFTSLPLRQLGRVVVLCFCSFFSVCCDFYDSSASALVFVAVVAIVPVLRPL